MVDQITNSPINALTRATQSSIIVSPRNSAQLSAGQPQKNAAVVVKASSVTQTGKSSNARSKLPRGSLVDVLA